MATLTAAEIRQYASAAGFSGNDLDIAVAVAFAESGGNPRSHNATPPDDSYGLWQINMLGKLGPDRRKRFGLSSNAQLFDPAINAKAARIIFQGSGWRAWTTYTRGTYKKFLSGGSGGSGGGEPDPSSPNPVPAASGTTGGLNALGTNIFNAMAGIGGVIAAIALLVLGVVILARSPIKSGIGMVAGVASPTSKLGSAARIAKKVSS
jgi:hypothetical protein